MTHMLMPQKNRKQTNCAQRDAEHGSGDSGRERRHEDAEDFVDRVAADPRLDAEPAARDQRAQQRRNVRAERAERGAAIHRKRNAVLRAGVRVEHHRNEHDEVAEENREDGLPPIHAAADERRGEHVGRDAGRHGNPQRGETADAPFAPRGRHRREVVIVKRLWSSCARPRHPAREEWSRCS